ncbi:MAG: lamin tail domain-containing protein [Kiritimatiellae bacterium]|nr:lamin tail domain-containing protein [Kiritimatiellia bacterium]
MTLKFLLRTALLIASAGVLHLNAAFAPVITEFMASNDYSLEDEDNSSSDWIEIYNRGDMAGDLEGWSLTDSDKNLAKWVFPATPLPAGAYLVVFASNKDRRVSGRELHTNFKLGAEGEYLALVKPDRITIASEYSPKYPIQLTDISYGLTMARTKSMFVTTNTTAQILVPEDDTLGLSWTQSDFIPIGWSSGSSSIGFDRGAVPVAGLVAHWPLDEQPGVVEISDVSAGGHHGSATAGVTPGAPGAANMTATAIAFSSGSIDVPYNAKLNPADFTVAVWARPTTGGRDYRSVITSRRSSSGSYEGYIIYLDPSNRWQFWTGSGSAWRQQDGPNAVMDQWTHIAITFDSATKTKAIHINGTLFASVTNQGYVANSTQPLHIGSGGDAGTQYYFYGAIDDVALFNIALDSTAIQDIMSSSVPESGLIDYREIIQNDLETAMYAINSSVYMRIPFIATNISALESMTLKMKYDDGFIAYLNGTLVASRNAPTTPQYNSQATERNHDIGAVLFEEFNISSSLPALQSGENVLAIHGLNFSPANEDFLIVPELSVSTAPTLDLAQSGYFLDPTPGAENARSASTLAPMIPASGHAPYEPLSTQSLVVTAKVAQTFYPISSVTLHYRAMYNPESTLVMLDNGTGGDAVAGDGVYSATIPAGTAAAGEMLRYYITAEDSTANTMRAPRITDTEGSAQSPEYFGARIQSPSVTSQLPIFYWWTQNRSASHTRAGTRCSVYYNGEFYDNVFVRQRGGYTNNGSQKFVFDKSHRLYVNEKLGRVREINMNAQGVDASYIRQPLAFQLFAESGTPACEAFLTLMRVNGGVDRVGVLIEQVDDNFLKRNNLDQASALYKCVQKSNYNACLSEQPDGIEKKLPEDDNDFSDLQALINGLALVGENERRAFLFDNFNVPEVVSYLAVRAVIQDVDDIRKNFYICRDTNDAGEWRIFPWDKDLTFGKPGDAGIYATHPFLGDFNHKKPNANQWSMLLEMLYTQPEFLDMYRRRTRTIMDTYLLPPGTPAGESWLEQRAAALFAPAVIEQGPSLSEYNAVINYFTAKRANLYVDHHASKLPADVAGIPDQQPVDAAIVFGNYEVSPASGNQAEEYIELLNTNVFSVDISGWSIRGGVVLTFAPGTVIPAGKTLYASPSVKAFRERSLSPKGGEGLFVVGGYSGHLSELGESLTLADKAGRIIDTLSYSGSPSAAQQNLRITEVMYHPRLDEFGDISERDFEFIEIKNIGSTAQDLTGVHFSDGIEYTFDSGVLAPGSLVVVARTPSVFATRYNTNSIHVVGPYNGVLSNGGEKITLKDSLQQTIASFTYSDGRGWPLAADGAGHSLVPTVDGGIKGAQLDYPGSWRASTYRDGSPGADDPQPFNTLFINEIAANTTYSNPARPEYNSNDWLELFNAGNAGLPLEHWYLSDDCAQLKKWAIPSALSLSGGEWIVFDEVTGFNSPLNSGFALKKTGEQVFLSYLPGTEADHVADAVRFEAQAANTTFSRYADGTPGWFSTAPTPAAANQRHEPCVVISRIMYHPAPAPNSSDNNTADEYVELLNPTEFNVPLWNDAGTWSIGGTITLTLPPATTIPAKERIILVSFNPQTNLVARSAFIAAHGMTNLSVTLIGPFAGALDNKVGRVTLAQPLASDTPGADPSWVTVDEVIYFNAAPWPAGADGTGASIERILADRSGSDPANWRVGGNLPDMRDMDLDGLPDLWELAWFGGTHASPYKDDDANNISNLDEYIAGTIPTDPTSRFEVQINHTAGTPALEFTALAASGAGYEGLTRLYTLESATSLRNPAWQPVSGYIMIIGADQIIRYNTFTHSTEFFRARAWLAD